MLITICDTCYASICCSELYGQCCVHRRIVCIGTFCTKMQLLLLLLLLLNAVAAVAVNKSTSPARLILAATHLRHCCPHESGSTHAARCRTAEWLCSWSLFACFSTRYMYSCIIFRCTKGHLSWPCGLGNTPSCWIQTVIQAWAQLVLGQKIAGKP